MDQRLIAESLIAEWLTLIAEWLTLIAEWLTWLLMLLLSREGKVYSNRCASSSSSDWSVGFKGYKLEKKSNSSQKACAFMA